MAYDMSVYFHYVLPGDRKGSKIMPQACVKITTLQESHTTERQWFLRCNPCIQWVLTLMGKHEYMCIRKHLPDCDQSYIKRHLKRDFSRSWGYFKLGLGGDVHREGGVRNGILCERCLEHRRYSDTAEAQRSQQWEAGVTLQGASRLEEGDKNWWTLERGSDDGRSAEREWLALARRRDTCSYEQVSLAVTWVSLEVEQW